MRKNVETSPSVPASTLSDEQCLRSLSPNGLIPDRYGSLVATDSVRLTYKGSLAHAIHDRAIVTADRRSLMFLNRYSKKSAEESPIYGKRIVVDRYFRESPFTWIRMSKRESRARISATCPIFFPLPEIKDQRSGIEDPSRLHPRRGRNSG
jgi:hypothetical protein